MVPTEFYLNHRFWEQPAIASVSWINYVFDSIAYYTNKNKLLLATNHL